MRCIFCKTDSSSSKSVEHIIPESLGNKNGKLLKGVVCDRCNNYFAHKIEKVVLEMGYFQSLRARLMIENKKGILPKLLGFTKNKEVVEVRFLQDDSNTIEVRCSDSAVKILSNSNEIYVPFIPEPPKDDINISKFLGKIALEALAKRVSTIDGWQNDFVDNCSLDELRNFVRYGKGYKIWSYHIRRIDSENQVKYDKKLNKYIEKLNEYDFLIPDKPDVDNDIHNLDNLYFVMAIMGIEYTINLTNAGLDRYIKWLSDNQGKSILQMEKSEFHKHYL